MNSESLLKRMNLEFSEEELADISRIMESQYSSQGIKLSLVSYSDDTRRRYVAFRTVPINSDGAKGSSQNSKNNDFYLPKALACFDVESGEG